MTGRPHGYARYRLDNCRCYVCGLARSEYDQRRNRLIAYGRWQPFVSPTETRTHIEALAAKGYGIRRIAELAGLDRKIVRDISRGFRADPGRGNPKLTKIRTETAAAILAVPLHDDNLASGALVDATDTWQRIHALIALGYPRGWIAQKTDHRSAALQLRRDQITAASATAIRELYEQVGDTPGPSARARAEGLRNGWLTPFQLEASREPIDTDAETSLDEIAVERLMGGTLRLPNNDRSPELVEAIRRLAGLGLNDAAIGERIGRTSAAVLKQRSRNDIPPGLRRPA